MEKKKVYSLFLMIYSTLIFQNNRICENIISVSSIHFDSFNNGSITTLKGNTDVSV